MKTIFIIGATGNIGLEVVKFLIKNKSKNKIVVGVRNIEKAKKVFLNYPKLNYIYFDFEKTDSFKEAFKNIDSIFLLRPPHISDVDKYFKPLIKEIKNSQIKETIFLSVQGVEKSKVIPHNKIEKLILEYKLDYIFIRPSYFMQNLTTTLINDIKVKRKIILPSKKAKFNWIDIKNIGEVVAILFDRFSEFKNQAYDLTGYENENFYEVTKIINNIIKSPIKYESVNPIKFFMIKKKEKMVKGMIMVMILLHFLPRFQKEPIISNFYEKLTGKKPSTLKEFIEREKDIFEE
jgi:uncharacterized protein YbjT (DUF2867 family)